MNKKEFENKIREDLSEVGCNKILKSIFEDSSIHVSKIDSPFDIYEEDRMGGGTFVISSNGKIEKGEIEEDRNGRRDHYWFYSSKNATYSISTEHYGHTNDIYINFTNEGKEELIQALIEKYWDEEDWEE